VDTFTALCCLLHQHIAATGCCRRNTRACTQPSPALIEAYSFSMAALPSSWQDVRQCIHLQHKGNPKGDGVGDSTALK